MKTRFSNYLRFNRAERNGTLALFALATFFFALPEMARHLRPARSTDFSSFMWETEAFRRALETGGDEVETLFNFDPNTATFEEFVRLGLSEKVAKRICNYRDKGGQFREPADFHNIWGLEQGDYARLLPFIRIEPNRGMPAEKAPEKPTAEPFAFNPNTATAEELLRLGLPARTVKSILNYRNKGGQFRKKEDLEKIYTLEAEDFERIAPYATFSAPSESSSNMRPVAFADGYPGSGKAATAKGPVDINLADIAAWVTLPGIGETRARQLVNYREKLGGFLSVEQLRDLYGLPDSVFQHLRPHLVLSTPDIRKINLNTASVSDLEAHPYISKRQAELIVAYREQHGAFASPEDLGRMRALSDQAWWAKVRPYLGAD